MTQPFSVVALPKTTLLVVDDDPVIRGLFKNIFENGGYTVLTASQGRDGINQLRQSTVQLLVTDLVMPEQEGLETIVAVRKEFPRVKILVVSGYPEYFKTALLCGARACLVKPVEPACLLKKVMEMVRSEIPSAGV